MKRVKYYCVTLLWLQAGNETTQMHFIKDQTAKNKITWNQVCVQVARHKLWRFSFISNVYHACMLLSKRFTIFPRNLSCQDVHTSGTHLCFNSRLRSYMSLLTGCNRHVHWVGQHLVTVFWSKKYIPWQDARTSFIMYIYACTGSFCVVIAVFCQAINKRDLTTNKKY